MLLADEAGWQYHAVPIFPSRNSVPRRTERSLHADRPPAHSSDLRDDTAPNATCPNGCGGDL
jgi:hypothetical protein